MRKKDRIRFYAVFGTMICIIMFVWIKKLVESTVIIEHEKNDILSVPRRGVISDFERQEHFSKEEDRWKEIDKRKTPSWFDEAKIGIFIHWGLYTVPSLGDEWFWWHWKGEKKPGYDEYMQKNFPGYKYEDFAKEFTARRFDAKEWAELFRKSGAKYVVLTSKHFEGYTLWPSITSKNWNSLDVGPKCDIVQELSKALKETNLRFGLYYSLCEWFDPAFLSDKNNGFKTRNFIYQKVQPQLYEVVNRYKPEILFLDGHWEASDKYWGSTDFLTWLYKDSPVKDTIVTNDRWGNNTKMKHGDYYSAGNKLYTDKVGRHKWENAITLDRFSWGYREDVLITDYISIEELLQSVVKTVSFGGNILINVGPTKEGIIISSFEQRLQQLGEWLELAGEGIYGSKPWIHQNDTLNRDAWYTTNNGYTYCFLTKWPKHSTFQLGAPVLKETAKVQILGHTLKKEAYLQWRPLVDNDGIAKKEGIEIHLNYSEIQYLNKWIWILKFREE